MSTVIVKAGSVRQELEGFKRVWENGEYQGEYMTFDSLDATQNAHQPPLGRIG